MSPLFILCVVTLGWLGLIVAGIVRDWPFACGVVLTLLYLAFLVIWAFDGAGAAVQEGFEEQP